MNKDNLVELILKRVLEEFEKEKAKLVEKSEELPVIYYLGNDEVLKDELKKEAKIIDNLDMRSSWEEISKTEKNKKIIISTLCIDGLISLASGKRSFVIDCLLDGGEVIVINEGLQYKKFENAPEGLIKIYDEYIEKIETFGIKLISRNEIIGTFEKKEEIYINGIITENKLRNLGVKNKKLIIKNNKITLLAQDYIKQNNIDLEYIK